jgi:chitinase
VYVFSPFPSLLPFKTSCLTHVPGYCGNSFLAPVIITPDTDCWMSCSADSTEMCGGPDRLSVYMVDTPAIVSSSVVLSSSSIAVSVPVSSIPAMSSSIPSPVPSVPVSTAAVSSVMPSQTSLVVVSSSPSPTSAYLSSVSSIIVSSPADVGPASFISSSLVSVAPTSVPESIAAQSSAIQSTVSQSSEPQTSTLATSSIFANTTSLAPSHSTRISSFIVTLSSVSSSAVTVSSSLVASGYPALSTASVARYTNSSASYSFSTITKSSLVVMSSAPTVSTAPVYTISTVFATTTYTITSCAATVTDCPLRIGHLTTETISLYTTYCPVKDNPTPTPAPAPTTAPAQSTQGQEMYTTVIVTTYIDICPTGLTTITTSSTMTLPINTAGPGPVTPASIPMTTSAATVTLEGSMVTLQLTVPVKTYSEGTQPNTVLSTIVVVPVPATTGLYSAGVPSAAGASIPATTKSYLAGNSTIAGASGSAVGTSHGVLPTVTAVPYSSAGKFQMSFGAGVFVFIGMLVLL